MDWNRDALLFRQKVQKALEHAQTILNTTTTARNTNNNNNEEEEEEDNDDPLLVNLMEPRDGHVYHDKFVLAETVTQTSLTALQTCLTQYLGDMSHAQWQQWIDWTHGQDNKTVTLRWEATEIWCVIHETASLVTPFQADNSSSSSSSLHYWNSTNWTGNNTTTTLTTTHTSRRVTNVHGQVTVQYSIKAFAGNDTEHAMTITERESLAHFVRRQANIHSSEPMPTTSWKREYPVLDLDLTWFLQQFHGVTDNNNNNNNNSPPCGFTIDRSTAQTPRRNFNVEKSVQFHKEMQQWMGKVAHFLVNRLGGPTKATAAAATRDKKAVLTTTTVQSTNLKHVGDQAHTAHDWSDECELVDSVDTSTGVPPYAHGSKDTLLWTLAARLRTLPWEDVFCPIQPFMQRGRVLQKTGALLAEHSQSLGRLLNREMQAFSPRQESGLITRAEATLVFVCLHVVELAIHYKNCVDYLEKMLMEQISHALGKYVTAADFDAFMQYHLSQWMNAAYAPQPFSYYIRQPGKSPSGFVAIESETKPIATFVRKVLPQQRSDCLKIPLNAAADVSITGDWYLHGWLLHQFGSADIPKEIALSARARQFRSFILVLGTMAGPGRLDPTHAIILQNQDDLRIPLSLEVLPSAKEFKNATASLSPEQRQFCQAYRAMQLGSSVFALLVIPVMPQIEKVLHLKAGSLEKELQLTQQIMMLFTEYQIPSDLLSFTGGSGSSMVEMLGDVKEHVSNMMRIIEHEKEKARWTEQTNIAPWTTVPDDETDDGKGPKPMNAPEDLYDNSTCRNEGAGDRDVISSCYSLYEENAFLDDEFSNEENPYLDDDDDDDDCSNEPEIDWMQQLKSRTDIDCSCEDFTLLPKELDGKLEKFDTDGALHPAKLVTGDRCFISRQERILASPKKQELDAKDLGDEMKKAFDLLDALTLSGSLQIDVGELHLMISLCHCFEKDLLGTVVQANINPIEKAEKSVLLFASTMHRVRTTELLRLSRDVIV